MKNLKLAVKLALGFGILVALAVFLGSMAVWQMQQVSGDADRLSAVNVPMLKLSQEGEGALLRARYAFHAYGLTGDDSLYQKGLPYLAEAQARLNEALALAGQYPALAGMKENLRQAAGKIAEYGALVAETAKMNQTIGAVRARQDESAARFLNNCEQLMDSENKRLDAEIQATVTATNLAGQAAQLKERLLKIMLVNAIIDAGNRLRVANWKSQAQRDPAVATTAMKDFDALERKFTELAAILKVQSDQEKLTASRQAAGQYKAAITESIAAETALVELGEKRTAVSDAALAVVNTNSSICIEQVAAIATQSSVNLARSAMIMIAGLLAAVALGILITVALTRGITRPILQGVAFANEMARGNFSQRLAIDQRDEVGVLARALNTVVENLHAQLKELKEGANVLGASASEIVASSTQLAASATESAAAVSETTTTVEEVRQTAQLANQKARAVADSAQKAAQTSQSGRKATDEVVAGMTSIRQQMEAIAASMVRLSEQSQAIGQIVATVEDLAAQSNLLAVNAAIEAAKAGEHGKGFSVVAQEVKSLAGQSRQATNQVRTILSDIQKATTAAVLATEQGSKAVAAGEKQTSAAGESIQALAGSVTEAAQAATQIAASGQQQLVGVDQVATAMESIKQASVQNVASARQLEAASRNLNELGARLKQMVEKYKV